jgi:hypothetical protein
MKELETLATGLLVELGRSMGMPSNLASDIAGGIAKGAFEALANPEALKGLGDLFAGSLCHTGLDVAQDALDACDHGQLSHEAALKIVAICLQDDAARKAPRKHA